nr:rap guanine nucleotide exchange factor 2-like [Ciona intestinalis]|eukprot:XP_009858872.1 rap guanine nucleotide exchange factor 2-like [Ciona intestinalis]
MNSEQLLPDEQIPDLLKEANFSFLDLNCFEVAVFLTRKDYKMFQATASTDFIEDLFHLDAELTQFKAFEDLVNRELFWVVTTLCNEPNLIQRSKIIKHFVKIAHHCKILKNLNSTFALISGLGYRAVSRMKQTWEKVPAKSNRLFEELQALMDPSRNMSKYRTLLNEMVSQPPVIPYIPVIKKDLTFLDLGNDTKVEGLINFEKMRMIGKEVRNVCRLCAPDSTQILPSAAAQQRESEKGSQNPIYLTLARRGRRSSFNNVRRLYEDQINVRRVKQYMQSIEVVSDEDKLMEMSKAVESVIPSASNQQKRRNTTASLPSDSPSRSSKTLPAFPLRTSSNGSSSSLHSRNNSEPQLAAVPVIALHPTRKKMPVSSLPKFGANSPQALRKLLSLSEEGGGNDKTGGKKLGTRRNGSVSSHDLSPATSPYMSPKRREDAQHSVANENINRNNNRLSLPTGVVAEPPSPSIQSAPINSRKFFPPGGSSATSSSRSSIASASSLGTVSSSNPTHSSLSSLGGSSSPRSSSPVGWGQSGGTTGPQLGPHPSHTHYHQQGRTSSSSSADTVKSGAGRHHERPVIKQTRNGRSSSFGGGGMMSSAMMSSIPDRRMNQMSSSTSTPSLSAPGSHQPLILPNHPQMPRTPSIDSGIVSVGSISSDSTRFNPSDDAEIFGRVHHHPGHQRQHPGRHLDQLHHRINEQSQLSPHLRHGRSNPPPQLEEEDKVEQTFLSGFRGHGDTPRPDTKVPSNFYPQSVTHVDHGGHPGEPMTIYGHVPPGQSRPMYMMPRNFGKSGVKGIHDYLICERHAMMRSRQIYANHHITYHRPEPVKTPEALLEDQLVLELQKQRPQLQRHKNSPISEDSNLSDKLSKSDPALNVPYPNPYEDPRIRLPPPARTSSPKSMIKQASLPHPSPLSPCNDNVFSHNHSYHTPNDSRSSFSTPNHSRPHITPPYPQNTPTSTPNTSRNIPTRAEDPSLNWQYPSRDPPIPRPTTLNTTSPYLNYSAQHGESALQDPITPQYDPHSNQYELYPIPVDMTPNSSIITTPHLPHSTQVPQHLINGSPGPQLRRKTSQDWNETDLDGEKNQQTMKAWGSSASLPATPLTSKSNNPQNPLPPHTLQPTLLHGSSISALTVTSKTKKPAPAPPQRTSSFARSRQLRISSTTSPTSESPPLSPLTPTEHCSLDVSTTCNGWMGNGHVITNGYTPSETRVAPLERRSLPTYTEAVNQINLKQSRFPAPLNNYRSFNIDAHENTEQVSQV